jgi:hypothetical protein
MNPIELTKKELGALLDCSAKDVHKKWIQRVVLYSCGSVVATCNATAVIRQTSPGAFTVRSTIVAQYDAAELRGIYTRMKVKRFDSVLIGDDGVTSNFGEGLAPLEDWMIQPHPDVAGMMNDQEEKSLDGVVQYYNSSFLNLAHKIALSVGMATTVKMISVPGDYSPMRIFVKGLENVLWAVVISPIAGENF